MKKQEYIPYRSGYSKGCHQAENNYFRQSEEKYIQDFLESITNYITEILRNTNLSDDKTLTEIREYCDVYNGGNNNE